MSPVLTALCELIQPERILEYGPGNYSTPYFANQGLELLVCVEQQSRSWFCKVNKRYEFSTNIIVHDDRESDGLEWLAGFGPGDLVLVDGKREHRVGLVSAAIDIGAVVVWHDSSDPSYRWDDLPGEVLSETMHFDLLSPRTSVYIPAEVVVSVHPFSFAKTLAERVKARSEYVLSARRGRN